jgi:hypothetical protein
MFVVAECDSVTFGSLVNTSRDDPQPAILWEEKAAIGLVQSRCEVISQIFDS